MRFIPAAITPISLCDYIFSLWNRNAQEKFENKLISFFDAKKIYTFSSLMRTVYACLLAIKKNNEHNSCIIPRYSCPSFLHGALAAGYEVRYCDVVPETLSIDLNSLQSIDTKNVRGVICSNLFGLANPVLEVKQFCDERRVSFIECVDYGIGTKIYGKNIGSFGDYALLNFQEGKALPIGGGGVVCRQDEGSSQFDNRPSSRGNYLTMLGYSVLSRPLGYGAFMALTRLLKIDRKRFSMEDTIHLTKNEFDFFFDDSTPLYQISSFQAKLGSLLLSRMDGHQGQRYTNACFYTEHLTGVRGVRLIRPEEHVTNIHYIRYPILVNAAQRDIVIAELLKNRIEASAMYVEHGMNIEQSLYPGANEVAKELITLPCHPYMTQDDLRHCVAIITKSLGGC